LNIFLKSLNGKFIFYWRGPPSECFWIGFHEEPEIEVVLQANINTKTRTFNLNQFSDLIIKILKMEIVEKMVYPDMEDISIPKLDKNKEDKYSYINYENLPGLEIKPLKEENIESKDKFKPIINIKKELPLLESLENTKNSSNK